MAGEITVNASLNFAKGNVQSKGISISSATLYNVTGTRYTEGVQTIPTTAGGTTINLGGLTGATIGWGFIKNLDATNFVSIMEVISTGHKFLKLLPGEFAMFRFGADSQVPAALADTGAVSIEFMIVEA